MSMLWFWKGLLERFQHPSACLSIGFRHIIITSSIFHTEYRLKSAYEDSSMMTIVVESASQLSMTLSCKR
uniref:Uncharacterized protein n=1 Tax=Leersia perrieri TaxID=77586 RepID=A0A0D9XYE8_9ORYZ